MKPTDARCWFYDDIMRIISYLPKIRQTLMFSATMPPRYGQCRSILWKSGGNSSWNVKTCRSVIQAVYVLSNNQKLPLINSLIADNPDYHSILIFSSTKRNWVRLYGAAIKKLYGWRHSSDLGREREKICPEFRTRKTRVLVATDVLSRGIDIKDINLVINFDAPSDAEDYVHRVVGLHVLKLRCSSYTCQQGGLPKMQRIEKLIGYKVNKEPLPLL